MPSDSIVDRLAALSLLAEVPRPELEWLVAHGEVRTFAEGAVRDVRGAPVDEMWVLLAGRVGLYREKSGGIFKVLQAGPGQVVGALPYSRFQRAPGAVVIEESLTALVLHRDHFPVMTRDCPALTTALVHYMVDRAREYRAVQLQDERLESLSRLASGFAHELNNPASAAARTAESLMALLDEEQEAARLLAGARLDETHLALVDGLRGDCNRPGTARSALETADREDDIADWLTRHHLDTNLAEVLSTSNVTIAALDELSQALPAASVPVVVRWVVSGAAARSLARQISDATCRIHGLVDSVRGFTFMDRQGVPENVDIARGLSDTVALLDVKARAKSVEVHLETASDLPLVHGFGSEINQVWQKVVDNAIDAVGDRGHVTITASRRGDTVLVRVADDGPGIPDDIQARVFDPFFTTKPVGKGAGLGLDIARRIVQRHGGDIGFTTQPGHTVFRVQLPTTGAQELTLLS